MKCSVYTIGFLLAAFSIGCVRAQATYPSYDRVRAKYAHRGDAEGIPADGERCDHRGCDCPRFWHYDHWVYHCDDQFLYWHHGYWYYYPNPHFYEFEGPHDHGKPHGRRVTKE